MKFTQEQIVKALQKVQLGEQSLRKIAKKVGCSHVTMYRWCRMAGVTPPVLQEKKWDNVKNSLKTK